MKTDRYKLIGTLGDSQNTQNSQNARIHLFLTFRLKLKTSSEL